MTEDDDLDGQIGGVTSPQSQEFEHPDEGDIEEGQGHRPPSLARRRCRNSPAQGGWMTFSAPSRSRWSANRPIGYELGPSQGPDGHSLPSPPSCSGFCRRERVSFVGNPWWAIDKTLLGCPDRPSAKAISHAIRLDFPQTCGRKQHSRKPRWRAGTGLSAPTRPDLRRRREGNRR